MTTSDLKKMILILFSLKLKILSMKLFIL